MRIEPCSFCGRPSYPSKGITFVRNDAKAFRFCRSKCHRNFKMKRNPRKLKWTKAHRRNAGKEMTVDSTLQFGATRINEPMRYDRDVVQRTLAAMKRITEIRTRRQRAFYKRRMAGKRQREVDAARKLVATQSHLLPRMRGSTRVQMEQRAAQEGVDVEELVEEHMAMEEENRVKGLTSKVFGGEKRRLRVRIDGEVDSMEVD
ncbi:hypothetical protein CDD81_366 [Ophiocordyceps australis]|uniref:Ribosome biogenesis protein RLP24 n=1 Tax=Ophiocordyceps australis TaxID=1399860 RepID=A0A2C5XG74_9HYPO|nr:hypothetical protein CDD81_366 [Ophiocordyceps australis]